MIHRAHHLQDERLFDSYMAERKGEPVDPPIVEHLADCESCGARYAELTAFMDTLRHAGDAEADSIFTVDRLRVQRQQIARRIEHAARPARVISFPGRLVRRTINASTARTAPRWSAAATAAALFLGAALGASYQWGARRGQRLIVPDTSTARATRMTSLAPRGTDPADIAADDAFLSDLEIALERPHTLELQAFDALTPHIREIRDQR